MDMTRMRLRTFMPKSQLLMILLLGIVEVSCYRLIPVSRPPFAMTGVVELVDGHELGLRHKSGQRVRIAVTPQTTILARDNPATITDVKIGMRIVVVYHFVDGAPTADEIRWYRP